MLSKTILIVAIVILIVIAYFAPWPGKKASLVSVVEFPPADVISPSFGDTCSEQAPRVQYFGVHFYLTGYCPFIGSDANGRRIKIKGKFLRKSATIPILQYGEQLDENKIFWVVEISEITFQ